MFVKIAILASQLINVVFFDGDEDEMLSSRCWRLKHDLWWLRVTIILDNLPILGSWKNKGMTHCESCYFSEKERIFQRIKDFE